MTGQRREGEGRLEVRIYPDRFLYLRIEPNLARQPRGEELGLDRPPRLVCGRSLEATERPARGSLQSAAELLHNLSIQRFDFGFSLRQLSTGLHESRRAALADKQRSSEIVEYDRSHDADDGVCRDALCGANWSHFSRDPCVSAFTLTNSSS